MLRPAKLNENLHIVHVYTVLCDMLGRLCEWFVKQIKGVYYLELLAIYKPWINEASELPHEKTLLDVVH